MDRNETIKILATLKAAYPGSYRGMTARDAEAMIELWSRMFAESYADVNAAVAALISTRTVGFSPTVGEVKDQLQKLRSANTLPEQEAWALVSRACRNGLYGYRQEFAKLPPEVQRAVGAPEQLREWAAMDADTLQSVVASNFMRAYRTQKARERENAMLPPEVRALITGLSDTLMIGGGEHEDR